VDQQLTQLEKQLVAISDFLDGASSSMFPSQILIKASDAPVVVGTNGAQLVAAASGAATGTGAAVPADDKLAAASTALQSAAFLVEDDLAAGS